MITAAKVNVLMPIAANAFEVYRAILTRAGLVVKSIIQRPADGMYVIEIEPMPGRDVEMMIHRQIEYQTYPAVVVFDSGIAPPPLNPWWERTTPYRAASLGNFDAFDSPNENAIRAFTQRAMDVFEWRTINGDGWLRVTQATPVYWVRAADMRLLP